MLAYLPSLPLTEYDKASIMSSRHHISTPARHRGHITATSRDPSELWVLTAVRSTNGRYSSTPLPLSPAPVIPPPPRLMTDATELSTATDQGHDTVIGPGLFPWQAIVGHQIRV